MIFVYCVVQNCKKNKFIKGKKTKRLFSSMGLNTTLSKVPILDNIYCSKYVSSIL